MKYRTSFIALVEKASLCAKKGTGGNTDSLFLESLTQIREKRVDSLQINCNGSSRASREGLWFGGEKRA